MGDAQGNASQARFNAPSGMTQVNGYLVCAVALQQHGLPAAEACTLACNCLQLICDKGNNRIKAFFPSLQNVQDVVGNGTAGALLFCVGSCWRCSPHICCLLTAGEVDSSGNGASQAEFTSPQSVAANSFNGGHSVLALLPYPTSQLMQPCLPCLLPGLAYITERE